MMTRPQFATFLHGTYAAVNRSVKREAKGWARAYADCGAFVEPEMKQVLEGNEVLCSDGSDLEHATPKWRVYFVTSLIGEICAALDWQRHEQVSADFERFVLQFDWGILYTVTRHPSPNSIPVVARRVDRLLDAWSRLATLRYVDEGKEPIELESLIRSHFEGLLNMWAPQATRDIRADLRGASQNMAVATAATVHEKIARAMANLAQASSRVKNKARLINVGFLQQELQKLDQESLDNLSTGHIPQLLRRIYIIDENLK